MKVGDLVHYQNPRVKRWIGTVIELPKATHAKEVQKVAVLTEAGIQTWIMQYCEVICGAR